MTTEQLMFSLIMIWAAGFALEAAAIIVRIAIWAAIIAIIVVRLMDKKQK